MHRIPHEGEVNRARYNPHEQKYIATRTPLGQIHIFNTHKLRREDSTPDIILQGHDTEGYALEWNPHRVGHILAGSYDGKLSLWDIKHAQDKTSSVMTYNPLANYLFHQQQIEDISHHRFHDSIFASSDDGGNVAFWDTRKSKQPINHQKMHHGTVYSAQFSPTNQFYLATGGADSLIQVWDLRNTSQPLFKMKQSQGQVTQVNWSTDDSNIVWSVCERRVTMWNVNQEKAKFVHGGHRANVTQIDTCVNEPDTIASVDQNNQLQIFQPNQTCKL